MYSYATVIDAISDLKDRGYTEDFNLDDNCLICNGEKYNPDDFEITEVYRFEGDSDPDEESVVYGVESRNGVKGVLINGYGYAAETMGEEITRKLRMHAH
jgi:hypothetical protein